MSNPSAISAQLYLEIDWKLLFWQIFVYAYIDTYL